MEFNKDEIIKALERCKTSSPEDCIECPYRNKGNSLYTGCVNTLVKDTLALINELTAKNDAIAEECCNLLAKVRKLTEENERLRAELADRPPKLVITKVNKEGK